MNKKKTEKIYEIKTIYDYYTLKIFNKTKTIKLIYRIRQYKLLKNQDEECVKRLKKDKSIKIKCFNINEKSVYYKEYALKLFDIDQKKKFIDKVFTLRNKLGEPLLDEITTKNETINFHKLSGDKLNDNESIQLDIIGSYLLAGCNFDEIFDNRDFKRVHSKETELTDGYIYNNKSDNNKNKNNKIQIRRWKKSKTYKINKLFSYDSLNRYNADGQYIYNTFFKPQKRYQFKRDAIIDSYNPYVSEWCMIDNDNYFEFEGKKYLIDNLKQYGKRKRHPKVDDFKNDYIMDKILVLKQNNNVYYFDMNINQIKNDNIIEV